MIYFTLITTNIIHIFIPYSCLHVIVIISKRPKTACIIKIADIVDLFSQISVNIKI